jgi:hypothetical protein
VANVGSNANINYDAGSISHWTLNIASPLTTTEYGGGGWFAMDSGAILHPSNTADLVTASNITGDGTGSVVITKTGSLIPASGGTSIDVPVTNAGTITSGDGALTLDSLSNTGHP